jgi:flagellar biosynthesis protein FlhF
MRLQVFHAPDMAAAMAQLRAMLGPDALILGTRRVTGGIELTAATEAEETMTPAPLAPRPMRDEDLPVPKAANVQDSLLAWHGVPEALAARLRGQSLDQALAAALPWGGLDLAAGPPLVVAGPPGAGKTLTVVRLATRLVLAGTPPLVVTADGRRAGAMEQLSAYTRLLGLTLLSAPHPATMGAAVSRRGEGQAVLVDMPGADPFDPAQRDEIAALVAAAAARVALVIPAGQDPQESGDMAEAFRLACTDAAAPCLIATRLDLARRIGGVLVAADQAGLALTEAGIGPGAADGLVKLTPTLLQARLEAAAPFQKTNRGVA